MFFIQRPFCTPVRITVTVAYILSSTTALASTISGTGSSIRTLAPQGFQSLDSDRQLVIDLYYGGQKLVQTRVMVRNGTLKFEQPAEFVSLVPGLLAPKKVEDRLSDFIPGNQAAVCGDWHSNELCGVLNPDVVGVIFDEDNFRAELFINPTLLAPAKQEDALYLSVPSDELSLVSRYGATLSGDARGSNALHVQNRTIISNGKFRMRGDSSLDTGTGASFDTLAVEHDRNDWRYTGGLLWAPGGDLLGRRRIVGGGIFTQLDTRIDRRAILGTPLALHVQRSARVDVLVDGRLLSSRIYAPGNILVDTANLPDGSYPVVLRIQESGRPPRDERQFFTKGAEAAPLGRPLYSAFAGFLADGNGQLTSRVPFYHLGAAYRVNPQIGVDAKVVGTSGKAIAEAGVIALTPVAKVRAAVLVSSAGDYGTVLRAVSSGVGPVSFSLDLRKVVSQNGGPVLPTSRRRGTFNEDIESQLGDQGSYSQGTGIVAARVSRALVRLTGLYRRNASENPDYSIGGSLEVPVTQTQKWNVVLQTDARKTNREVLAFFGMRASFNRRRTSIIGTGGYNYLPNAPSRVTGEVQAAVQRELGSYASVAAEAALGRDPDASFLRSGVRLQGDLANMQGEVFHRFGDASATQYAASVDGGIAFLNGHAAFAGREVSDSAIVVSTTGGKEGDRFEVLLNDAPRAVVRPAKAALIFLQPYEQYKVRLRPLGDSFSYFDASERPLATHPGQATKLNWSIDPTFVIFGRVLTTKGAVIGNADISGDHGIARTDALGHFQIEARGGDVLQVKTAAGLSCRIPTTATQPHESYFAAGDVACQ